MQQDRDLVVFGHKGPKIGLEFMAHAAATTILQRAEIHRFQISAGAHAQSHTEEHIFGVDAPLPLDAMSNAAIMAKSHETPIQRHFFLSTNKLCSKKKLQTLFQKKTPTKNNNQKK